MRWAEWDVYNGKWLISAEIMNNSPRTLLLRAFHEGSVVFESEFYPGDHRSAILNADPGSVNEVTSIRIEDQLGRKVVEFRKEQNMLYPGPELCLQFLPDQSTHIQATNLTVYWLDANFKTENGGGTSLLAPWSQADFYIGGKVGEAWLEVLGQTPFYRAEWDWSKLEPGVFGYAADLNGGAFLQINASEPLNISLASTVELWFKPAKPAFNAYLVSKMSGTVHRRILSIRV